VAFLQCPKSVSVSFKREVWLYDKVDKQKIIEKLEIVDWITLLYQFDDVDDMCNQFTKTFLELARDPECIPTKTVIVRYNDKPWFTNEVRKEIRIRDRLRKVML
jgi:hypothetical protein